VNAGKDIAMRTSVAALLLGLAPCAPVLAAEGHAPGIVKPDSQIKAELDRSISALI
jgi:hypothetical protein